MSQDQPEREIYDLAQLNPHWRMRVLERMSLRKALEILHIRQAQQIARARTVAGAITTLQDYKKAVRDFIGIIIGCPLVALLHVINGSTITGMLWLGVAPLMWLNWRKAYKAKVRAKAVIDINRYT